MTKGIFLLTTTLLLSISLKAQAGKQMPPFSASTAMEQVFEVPASFDGKMAIIGMAFSEKAEQNMRGWYTPVYQRFIQKVGMYDMMYDAHAKILLMFTGVNKAAIGKAKKEFKKQANDDMLNHVLFYAGDWKTFQKELGLKDKSSPYIFAIDENGKVLGFAEGRYTLDKLDKLSETIEL